MDNKDLLEAINQVMPYGKYKGLQLLDLPEPLLVWVLMNHPNHETHGRNR